MGALTPGRPALRLSEHEHRLCRHPGLSASCARPSNHSVPNHHARSTIALTRYPSASWTSGLPRSGLRHSAVGSPQSQAESGSLALRTGHSPPVASHLSSRRRSYFRLQVGERLPGKDLHLSDQAHLRTHDSGSKLPHSRIGTAAPRSCGGATVRVAVRRETAAMRSRSHQGAAPRSFFPTCKGAIEGGPQGAAPRSFFPP